LVLSKDKIDKPLANLIKTKLEMTKGISSKTPIKFRGALRNTLKPIFK
jgi:hypothetical protein